MTLEEFLNRHFTNERVFKENGEPTTSGEIAYSKLIRLIYDLAKVTPYFTQANEIIDDLDNVMSEKGDC